MTNDEIRAAVYRIAQKFIEQADKKPTPAEQALIKDAVDIEVNLLQNLNTLTQQRG